MRIIKTQSIHFDQNVFSVLVFRSDLGTMTLQQLMLLTRMVAIVAQHQRFVLTIAAQPGAGRIATGGRFALLHTVVVTLRYVVACVRRRRNHPKRMSESLPTAYRAVATIA